MVQERRAGQRNTVGEYNLSLGVGKGYTKDVFLVFTQLEQLRLDPY